jgi:hypothetical protein
MDTEAGDGQVVEFRSKSGPKGPGANVVVVAPADESETSLRAL